MDSLSLRLRVFLFFALIGIGGTGIVGLALWLGFRQLGDPQALSAFVTVIIVSAFGLLGLAILVWRLFDENLSKPIEGLAAQLRVRADAGIDAAFDTKTARYLGDLAPAARILGQKLGAMSDAVAENVAQKTARLERQRAQLLRILSDIPTAVIVATRAHQIVLYDGQAADLMEREAPARLNGSLFDYLDRTAVIETLSAMQANETARRDITVTGKSGAIYTGHIRLFPEADGYTLMLKPLAPDAARPLVYDFDLLSQTPASGTDDTPLRNLTFVIFDSETTGLDPARDAVIQLGAVRVVNGRIITSETFETLVDPGRPIPPASTKVHRIHDTMVAGAPDFAQACTRFHAFASGSVMVAHNAPFDMAFLHRQTRNTARPFDNPVLDTVHLSAIIFGGSAEHTLDAICDKLQVEIAPELRHTALGDAMATAQAFVAMLPILEGRGLHTFGQVRAEMQKHSRILEVEG